MRPFYIAVLLLSWTATILVSAQAPAQPNKVESASVTALTGLTVPQFEQEMQHFVQALGVSCGGCHMPKGNFVSDENPRKVKARQMIAMTKALNQQFFPNHIPAEGESTLGRVTCYTCHQGEAKPKVAP
ncbi:MAG TPA: c-type cytochrome [Vicinamibacterales bacterium]|nr:c-type cytochrome [Vicinamibacterales bacterium]